MGKNKKKNKKPVDPYFSPLALGMLRNAKPSNHSQASSRPIAPVARVNEIMHILPVSVYISTKDLIHLYSTQKALTERRLDMLKYAAVSIPGGTVDKSFLNRIWKIRKFVFNVKIYYPFESKTLGALTQILPHLETLEMIDLVSGWKCSKGLDKWILRNLYLTELVLYRVFDSGLESEFDLGPLSRLRKFEIQPNYGDEDIPENNTGAGDFRGFVMPQNIEELKVSRCDLTEYQLPEKLVKLSLFGSTLSYDSLKHLTNLKSLTMAPLGREEKVLRNPEYPWRSYIENHWIVGYDGYNKLKNLSYLELSSYRLSHCEEFKRLTQLTTLLLNDNLLTTFDYDSDTLKVLNLAKNKLTDLDFLEKLPALQELDISHNKITDFNPLRLAQGLRKLTVSFQEGAIGSDLEEIFEAMNFDLFVVA